jgi:hypothetical protein
MANPQVEEWLQQSQWVIRGTIDKVGATTMKAVPVSGNVAIVRVEDILDGPSQFADQRGREITLYSGNPQGLVAGKRAVFFTRSWLYGESLAVIEVGRFEEGDQKALGDEITSARQNIEDRRLGDRIAKAELVVAGRVVETARARQTDARRVETEHAPDWWQAEIDVQAMLKGTPREKTAILYANSLDEMWIDSPKFKPGQEGIWILQRDQQEKGWPVLRIPGLTALDPLDYQPTQQLDRVRKLVAERR